MQIAKISGQNSAFLLMETVFDIVSLRKRQLWAQILDLNS